MSTVTAVVDAHVHIHACYEPDELFDNAFANLSRAAGLSSPKSTATALPERRAFFLLMTECAQDDYFGALRQLAQRTRGAEGGNGASGRLDLERWSVAPTAEDISLLAQRQPAGAANGREIYIVAGRQIACREGLEVLVIGTTRRFEDGRPIREILTETEALGVPRVIPWGPGKWFFRRGKLLNELLREFRKPTLFLGDEGGRPGFWGYPAHFGRAAQLGIRDLPGTDPLPFPHDVTKVGLMGLRVPVDLDRTRPAASLLRALIEEQAPYERFATLEPPLRFVRNQIGMQLRKRRSA
jgi:hypothetical protein